MKRLKRTPRAKVALTRVQFHILCDSVISQEKEEMESEKGVGMEHKMCWDGAQKPPSSCDPC